MQNTEKQENPLINFLFNIIIPVYILNKGSKYLGPDGPMYALIIALAFPVLYGLYDLIQRKKTNYISIFGIVNILFTGGLALMKLDGIWFAVKEAAFPLLIGAGVLITAFTAKPAFKMMAWNPQLLNIKLIEERILGKEHELHALFKTATFMFAFSFLISAVLNFALATYIFTPIDPSLSETAQTSIINEQVAKMTWMGFVVIAFPLMFFMAYMMWYVFKGLKRITGLETTELMAQGVQPKVEASESEV